AVWEVSPVKRSWGPVFTGASFAPPDYQPSSVGDVPMYRATFAFLALAAVTGCRSSDPIQPPAMQHNLPAEMALRNPELEKSPEVQSGLAQIREATAAYHDFDAAVAAGYTGWCTAPAQ